MTNQIFSDVLNNLCYWQRLYIQEKLLNKTLSKDFLLKTVGEKKSSLEISATKNCETSHGLSTYV